VFSHLSIDEAGEWDVLRKSAETLKISVIARDIDRIWEHRHEY